MLGKLMKYDLRSGIRTFALIWIGLAALAAINGLTLRIAFDGDIQSELANFIITVLPMVLLVALYVAMGIFMLVFIINRFYKGLLGDEGYLMFTLPVLSGGLLFAVLAPANLREITAAVRDMTDYLAGNPLPAGTGWLIAEFAVYMLIAARGGKADGERYRRHSRDEPLRRADRQKAPALPRKRIFYSRYGR